MIHVYLLTIGTELTSGIQDDSNSTFLAGRLSELGMSCSHIHSTSDEMEAVVHGIRDALELSDVIVMTGGLGPTDDDITREAVGVAVGSPLIRDEKVEAELRRVISGDSEKVLKMADRPSSATMVPPGVGIASGLRLEADGKVIYALPGVPEEMREMFESHVVPDLVGGLVDGRSIAKIYKTCGLSEIEAEDRISPHIPEGVRLGILPQVGEVHLRVIASSEAEIGVVDRAVNQLFSEELYGVGDDSLASVVGRELLESGEKLSAVESCTGGLISKLLTDVAGSSHFFEGSIISYSNRVKSGILGIPDSILAEHGAVSRECAVRMARMGLEKLGSDMCVAVTGIAGPDGATAEKPIGLVYIALATREGDVCNEHFYKGSRDVIRHRSAKGSLDLVRRYLSGLPV